MSRDSGTNVDALLAVSNSFDANSIVNLYAQHLPNIQAIYSAYESQAKHTDLSGELATLRYIVLERIKDYAAASNLPESTEQERRAKLERCISATVMLNDALDKVRQFAHTQAKIESIQNKQRRAGIYAAASIANMLGAFAQQGVLSEQQADILNKAIGQQSNDNTQQYIEYNGIRVSTQPAPVRAEEITEAMDATVPFIPAPPNSGLNNVKVG